VEKLEILNLFSFFERSSPAFREEVEDLTTYATLPVGAHYFRPGDSCTSVVLLGRGNVRVFKTSDTGREITLYHVEAGESCLLTLHCALNEAKYAAEALVEEDVEAVLIPVPQFRAWVDRDREIRLFVFGTMAHRVIAVTELLEDVLFHKLDQRLAAFLVSQFEIRDASSLAMTHHTIAAELGSARETVSRLLKDFERRGALELGRGQIRLLDEPLLRELQNRG
jgi:CRP/FNR family transcriptional regulator